MKRFELENLKKLRAKNYKDLLDYLNTNLPKNYNETEGNIKEVLQWGNVVKLIYIYLTNEYIHNTEMNKKVNDLKNAHFEISKLKSNVADKIKDNIEYADYKIDSKLVTRSIMDEKDYISVNRVASLIPNMILNKKINKEYKEHEKNGLDMMSHMLDYVGDFYEVIQSEDFSDGINRITPLPGVTVARGINERRGEQLNKLSENKKTDGSALMLLLDYLGSDVDFYKEIEISNRRVMEEKLNDRYGIRKSKELYKDIISKETNPEIIEFIKKYQKIK